MARAMKNSGIEWIGEIPEEWETIKNKYLLCEMYSGGTPTASNEALYCDDGIPFVSISDMSCTPYVCSTKKSLTDLGVKEKNLKILPVGTILYSIYATIGAISELGIPATISQAMLALQIKETVQKSWYKYNLTAMRDFIFFSANGNTQFNLNAEKVWNFSFVLPIKYGLSAGDILYAEMPYTTELQRVTVTAIGRSDYGIENPRVSSELGVVCLGYVPQHHESVIGKYILFSNRSMASELSQFPQIIDSTFSRSQLVAAVQKETMPFVLWYCFAGAVILVGQWLLVFRKSAASIDIRRRKGMVAGQCFMVSLIEKTVMILVPVITTAAIMCWALQLASIYIAIMILSVIMAIVMIGVAVIAEAIIRR